MFKARDNDCESILPRIFLEAILIVGILLMASPLLALASNANEKVSQPVHKIHVATTKTH